MASHLVLWPGDHTGHPSYVRMLVVIKMWQAFMHLSYPIYSTVIRWWDIQIKLKSNLKYTVCHDNTPQNLKSSIVLHSKILYLCCTYSFACEVIRWHHGKSFSFFHIFLQLSHFILQDTSLFSPSFIHPFYLQE